jgi:hypothetical protein
MTDSPKRFLCRQIHTNGRRCSSPCLRGHHFCYFHYNARYPAPAPPSPPAYVSPDAALLLPNLEDRLSIQCALSEIARRIAANQIDLARARLLVYTLQVASSNLGRNPRAASPPTREPAVEPLTINDVVEDIQLDPTLGPLAPIAEALAPPPTPTPSRSPVERFVEEVLEERAGRPAHYPNGEPHDPALPWSPEPATLPTVRAVADDTPEPAFSSCHPAGDLRFTPGPRPRITARHETAVSGLSFCHPRTGSAVHPRAAAPPIKNETQDPPQRSTGSYAPHRRTPPGPTHDRTAPRAAAGSSTQSIG